jgi:uncharacterized protein
MNDKKIRMPLLAAALCLLPAVLCLADGVYPQKAGPYVNDYAGILKDTDKTSIAGMLGKTDEKNGTEVDVVCVNSVNDYFPGEDIEDFASGLFKQWNIGGRTGRGMLLLISISDRRIAIEMGNAKQGTYDAFMKQVVSARIIPHFKDGDYSRGIYEGARAVSNFIEKQNTLISIPVLMSAAAAVLLAVLVIIFIKKRRVNKGKAAGTLSEETGQQDVKAPEPPPAFGGGSAGNW